MRVPAWMQTPELRGGVASGVLLAAAAPPSPLGFLAWGGLLPLLWVLFDPRRQREGPPLRLRTLILSFGLTRHLLQLHWLVLLGDASPLTFRWALPFMLVLLALYATIPDALVIALTGRLRDRGGLTALWWFPGLWVLGEWTRGLGEMGFPWLSLAATQLRIPVVLPLAGLLGELGVSLFVLWCNALLLLILLARRGCFPRLGRAVLNRWWAPVTLLLMVAGVGGYGVRTIRALESAGAAGPSLRVAGIQANVDLRDKWDPAKRDSTFVPYDRLSRRAAQEGARLVVWPETAIPFDLPRRPEYYARVRDMVRETGIYLHSGYVERRINDEGRIESYNSSFLMADDGAIVGRYRKMHLLPLGERMPFQSWLPWLGEIDFGQAEWTPGPERTVFEVDGHRFSTLICFESIFSRFSREAVQRGAGMLVNITNDGWFGRTVLPEQHAWMSVLRACENRVPLVRVANNGISFVVRPTGEVVARTGLFERAHFTVDVTPRPGGSFYTRHGDTTLFVLLAVGMGFLLVVTVVSRRRAR